MSSFVVNKVEFIKAAGLIYGVLNNRREKSNYFLSHLYDKFVECYMANEESVAEQYDEEVSYDDKEYKDVFEAYKAKGSRFEYEWLCGRGEMSVTTLKASLHKFFNSVLYQIENERLYERTAAFFYQCISCLSREQSAINGWWGEVEIDLP